MGRCLTVAFILSGVLFAGIGYFLYDPIPGDLDNVWGVRMWTAQIKMFFLIGELKYKLGMTSRLEAVRTMFADQFQAPLTLEDKENLEIYDTKLEGVPVRVYKPKSAKDLLPGLVFYHGGGWILLDVPSYDGQCAYIARKSNIVVISVEYRLAPEFPFPAGFNDCLTVVKHVLQKGKELGVDSTKVGIGGDSAGGNLAAAVSTKLRDEKFKPVLKAQILIYGAYQFCDLSLPCWKIHDAHDPSGAETYIGFLNAYFNLTESQKTLFKSKRFLTKEHQERCHRNVDYKLLPKDLIPEGHTHGNHLATEVTEDLKILNNYLLDPRFAPMLMDDVSNLPPSFVLASGWDRLRDENLIYAERLRRAGNTVELLHLPDSFHGILNQFDEKHGFANGPILMKRVLSFIDKYLK